MVLHNTWPEVQSWWEDFEFVGDSRITNPFAMAKSSESIMTSAQHIGAQTIQDVLFEELWNVIHVVSAHLSIIVVGHFAQFRHQFIQGFAECATHLGTKVNLLLGVISPRVF